MHSTDHLKMQNLSIYGLEGNLKALIVRVLGLPLGRTRLSYVLRWQPLPRGLKMLGAFYEYKDLCSIIILQSDEVIAP